MHCRCRSLPTCMPARHCCACVFAAPTGAYLLGWDKQQSLLMAKFAPVPFETRLPQVMWRGRTHDPAFPDRDTLRLGNGILKSSACVVNVLRPKTPSASPQLKCTFYDCRDQKCAPLYGCMSISLCNVCCFQATVFGVPKRARGGWSARRCGAVQHPGASTGTYGRRILQVSAFLSKYPAVISAVLQVMLASSIRPSPPTLAFLSLAFPLSWAVRNTDVTACAGTPCTSNHLRTQQTLSRRWHVGHPS